MHSRRLPPVTLPALSLWQWLLKDMCMIAVVSYAVSISLARLFSTKYNYDIDASQVLYSTVLCCS